MAQKLAGKMIPVEIDLGALPENFFFFSGFILQVSVFGAIFYSIFFSWSQSKEFQGLKRAYMSLRIS